ncbi:hypothetical protein FRB96_002588 [Tulasnella sp. 330]|nr:hypothetical protein FRB96_002588 [Tulasnella sp. 330]KAG8872431.1 hypothetical protein FRB97_007637 [Tulasnella sp. 331]
MFLIEKVYIVWAPYGTGKPTSRLRTPVFVVCMCMLMPLLLIAGLMIWGRISMLRSTDQVCIIGLRRAASLSLICYDLFMTIMLTTLFVWPLFTGKVSGRLRNVASRTLVASLAALTTSCVNIIVLTLLHGKELGWVCLASCGTDVTLNAIAIYWVTNASHVPQTLKETPPALNVAGHSIKSSTDSPHSPAIRHSHSQYINATLEGGAVPANVSAGRTTRFAPSVKDLGTNGEDKSATSSNKRVEGGRSSGSWFGGLFDAVRRKEPRIAEEHAMSVQARVTITTEQQMPRVDEDEEFKYPLSESSVGDDLGYTVSEVNNSKVASV